MSVIISIEGNIGSGKSTLVSKMKEQFETINGCNVIFLQEPVDIWESICDENGVSILTKFYDNQSKYAFSFQMMAYITRLKLLMDTINSAKHHSIIICERSIWTDKNVFAKMLFDEGKIEDVNYIIYNKWFEHFSKDCGLDGIIYLDMNANICEERIIKRGRIGEKIPITYLETCENYHNKWIGGTKKDVLRLNDNTEETFSKIETFVKNIQKQKGIEINIDMNKLFEKTWC